MSLPSLRICYEPMQRPQHTSPWRVALRPRESFVRMKTTTRSLWAVLVGLGWRAAGLRADDLRTQIFGSFSGDSLWCFRLRFLLQPQRNQSRREILVQLTDEAVVATGFVGREVLCLFVSEVCGCGRRRQQGAAVTVRRLDGRAVKDKDDQQQTEPARERGAAILK